MGSKPRNNLQSSTSIQTAWTDSKGPQRVNGWNTWPSSKVEKRTAHGWAPIDHTFDGRNPNAISTRSTPTLSWQTSKDKQPFQLLNDIFSRHHFRTISNKKIDVLALDGVQYSEDLGCVFWDEDDTTKHLNAASQLLKHHFAKIAQLLAERDVSFGNVDNAVWRLSTATLYLKTKGEKSLKNLQWSHQLKMCQRLG
ncbi:hypothetical protein BLNAU_20861 [Blattamonas nauphoetae]|uniref:Uncharacterized protein n=1 Tax=Blattamonas nauphoetae TaxID=2049346 RepID=A0ABQ9WXL2_9EUKA|nr:hypothetical protein BLNAU_20861 [Blattamonas nauphoetae]